MAEDLEEDLDVEEHEGGEQLPPPRDKRKLLIFVLLPVLLLIGGLAGAYFSGAADPVFALLGGGEEDEAGEEAAKQQPSVYYDLPEMLVNLNSAGRKQNYLKIKVALELGGNDQVQRVEAALPRIIDNFQVYLRELRVEDLEGAGGLYRLREELLTRVKAEVAPAEVRDVLFREMLVQ